MYKIIIDTDILLHCVTNKVDIFSELNRICDFSFKIYMIDQSLNELKNKKNAKLALNLIKNRVEIIETGKNKTVDDLILDLDMPNLIVCTNDAKLKEKLKKRNIPIITLRQGKYLVIKNVL